VATTDVMLNRPCYEVEFSDGSLIVADAQHQWVTTTRAARRAVSDRVPARHYWSPDAVARAGAAASKALLDSDRLVTSAEAVGEAGSEFRHVIHAVARQVGPLGRQVRLATGARRSFEWHAPVYSRQQLLADLAARVSRPVNAWHAAQHSQIVTTEAIAATLRCSSADGRLNHAVRLARPFDLPEKDLPLPPYALGVWLGDGDSSGAVFTSYDPEIAANVRAEGLDVTEYRPHRFRIRVPQRDRSERRCVVCGTPFVPATSQVRTCGRSCGGRATMVTPPVSRPSCPDCGARSSGLRRCQACHRHHGTVNAILRHIGVLGGKHIPDAYLRASERQRRALLAGLLDTDGSVSKTGCVQFDVTNRRLAEGALELILSLGYRARIRTRKVSGRTEETSTCYRIAFTPGDPVFRLHRKLQRQRFEHAPTSRTVVDVRRIPSVPVRCVEVDNVEHLYLAGQSCIPTHNSTLGLDISRTAAIRHQLTTVMFSLEMSRNEITMRLLSAEGRVPLHHMRSGQMTDDDWNRIARRTGEVSSAPLFIDDSPNMTMMEIRAKCRRLKQRHDLRLVVIDYLQLMTSGKKVESRQQEVAEFSRALKLLAKELALPVVAISQLNRSAEQRQDKKPMLADLRESGCVTAATRVLRADTGAEVPIGELATSGERDVPVWALDESLRYVRRTLTHAFPSGRKTAFRVRLASGKTVEATANHRFLTHDGWFPLAGLGVGSRVAVARHVPAPAPAAPWPDDDVIAMADRVGGGSFLPSAVFSLPKTQIAVFLRHLWATRHGAVTVDRSGGTGRISYASTSRDVLRGVAGLLLRFGISTRTRGVTGAEGSAEGVYTLEVAGRDEQVRFLREIGCHGLRSGRRAELLAVIASSAPSPSIDTIPTRLWDRVQAVMADRRGPRRNEAATRSLHVRASTRRKPSPSQERLGRVAALLADADLEMYATNDVLWDSIASVEPIGEHDVYDATVLGVHNFVGNGIALHNSIEQDADMVILLHREDAYEKESPRAGEADFIVAKHRNGPTATITVAFQGHYSRFVDMAQ
jgi:replicative DNA helicase